MFISIKRCLPLWHTVYHWSSQTHMHTFLLFKRLRLFHLSTWLWLKRLRTSLGQNDFHVYIEKMKIQNETCVARTNTRQPPKFNWLLVPPPLLPHAFSLRQFYFYFTSRTNMTVYCLYTRKFITISGTFLFCFDLFDDDYFYCYYCV